MSFALNLTAKSNVLMTPVPPMIAPSALLNAKILNAPLTAWYFYYTRPPPPYVDTPVKNLFATGNAPCLRTVINLNAP